MWGQAEEAGEDLEEEAGEDLEEEAGEVRAGEEDEGQEVSGQAGKGRTEGSLPRVYQSQTSSSDQICSRAYA